MTTDLQSRIDALPSNTDYADAATYAALMQDDGSIGDDDTAIEDTEAATNADEVASAQGETNADETAQEQGEQPPADAEPAAAESSETPAAAEKAEAEVVGVLTKDGKHVLPLSVLNEQRRAAQVARDRAKELEAQNAQLATELEALRTGKQVEAEASKKLYSQEQIDDAAADFPVMAEMMKRHNEQTAEMAELRKEMRAAPVPATRVDRDDEVQSLIDQRPLLALWQAEGGKLWAKAVALDKELQDDDGWQDKSKAERFAAVEASVAARYGVQPPKAVAAPPTKQAAPKPSAKPAEAKEVMPTLSDFGGRAAVTGKDEWEGLSGAQMQSKAAQMDVESLRRMVGVNY